nr:uncharacterized mitochondrial protein AtMg00810-like [Tanacetum cinerariifolium]
MIGLGIASMAFIACGTYSRRGDLNLGPKEANISEGTQDNADQNANSEEIDLHERHFILLIYTPLSTAGPSRAFNDSEPSYSDDLLMPHLEVIFADSSYDDEGVVTDFNNLDTTVNVSLNPTTRIQTIHLKTQILKDPMLVVQTRSKVNKNSKAHALISQALEDESWVDAMNFLAFASYMGFIVYQMDVKSAFLYGTINEEVYVSQPPSFVELKFSNKVYKVVKALYGLHQALRAWSSRKKMVTPKTSHLQAVKRIFRYLNGQPKLGLWYPKVSSFNLEAYSDSDYASANLDRKSTTGGCKFLGRRLISWQWKKQTIMATSTTDAEYVANAHYRGQVL